MAAMAGVAALPDGALRTHPVLGDPAQRESVAGVDAFLAQHLEAEELQRHRTAFTARGYTRVRRLVRATLEDLTRAADAEDEAERGVGLPVGLARDLLGELGVVAATFYVPEAAEEDVIGAAEVVQQAQVLQVAPSLEVPEWPKGSDLPTRDIYREWLRLAGGMVASCSDSLMADILAISKDPAVDPRTLTEWHTTLDRRLGTEILKSMDSKVSSRLDPKLVSSGYGLAILQSVAESVIVMTERGLKRRLDMFRDPVPVKSKSDLHRRIQQWVVDVRDLTDEGQEPSDLDKTSSFKKLVSGVHEAKKLVDALQERGVLDNSPPSYHTYKRVLEREALEWYKESLESKEKAKVANTTQPREERKWCFEWVMEGSCSQGSTCDHTHDPKLKGKPTQWHLNHFKRPCGLMVGGVCPRLASGKKCYFTHPETQAAHEEGAGGAGQEGGTGTHPPRVSEGVGGQGRQGVRDERSDPASHPDPDPAPGGSGNTRKRKRGKSKRQRKGKGRRPGGQGGGGDPEPTLVTNPDPNPNPLEDPELTPPPHTLTPQGTGSAGAGEAEQSAGVGEGSGESNVVNKESIDPVGEGNEKGNRAQGVYPRRDPNPDPDPNPVPEMNVIADTGATSDVVGSGSAGNIVSEQVLSDPITLETAGESDEIVTSVVDVDHGGGLRTQGGLKAPWAVMTLISVTLRLLKGGVFWAKGDEALLIDEEGSAFPFKLIDGLFRFVPGGMSERLEGIASWLQEGPDPPGIASWLQEGPDPPEPSESAYKVTNPGMRPRVMSVVVLLALLSLLGGGQTLQLLAGLMALINKVKGDEGMAHLNLTREAYKGVEISTSYGFVRLLKDKESPTVLAALQEIERELKVESREGVVVDLIRVHSDNDSSFKGVVSRWLIDKGIKQTHTGGYRPQSNSVTERRIRTLKEGVKAMLLQCTGGLGIYNTLWGPAMVHANYCYNRSEMDNGKVPYVSLTGKEVKWDKDDLVFGQEVLYHKPNVHRADDWDTPGGRAIWLGRDPEVTNGHRVAPITWDLSLSSGH